MDEEKGRLQLVETGKALLASKLVARTWGNISCRLDENRFLITPSGLDYLQTTPQDIVCYDRTSDTWEGIRKPSSEKGIHAAAYEIFPEVDFVIHTHQTYATALGLAGWDALDLTEEERDRLGGVARAEYGLPGKQKLWNNVRTALQTGAKVILMAHHGAMICGSDMEDTLEKAALLEEICKRNCKGFSEQTADKDADAVASAVKKEYPLAMLASTDALLAVAAKGSALPAQLDDMAQMIGRKIPVVRKDAARIISALKKHNAVLVPGLGAIVCGCDKDDSEALCILADKAAVSALHTAASHTDARLSFTDAMLMHAMYKFKYSKQKKGDSK